MAHIPALFQPMSFRAVTTRNRIVVSPMCQYSATDGLGDDWHVQNLGAKAAGGAGIVFTEATHVSAIARITPGCLGLWTDAQQALATRLASLITRQGAVPGMQIAHAGRKASCTVPWQGGAPIPVDQGGWVPLAPSALPFSEASTVPHALSLGDIGEAVAQFAAVARRSLAAGFRILELHGAYGYLAHEFLSPVSNQRTDAYGGDLTRRARFLMEVIDAVRAEMPADLPLFVRLSCSDYLQGGLTLDDIVQVAHMLKARGDVDLIDCSGGGISPAQKIPALHGGYQVPFADRIRNEVGIATGAVGLIHAPEHADEIIANGRADLVFLARAILVDQAWPIRAARVLGAEAFYPPQYLRALVG